MFARRRVLLPAIFLIASHSFFALAQAQPLGQPDRGEPGDEMIQAYLAHEAAKISARFGEDLSSKSEWEAKRPAYVEQYFYMLGLSPRPEKTPLTATVTGSLKGDGYLVDMLHYQSRPGLYVTGNLYRPAGVQPGEKLPAVFYVCGHSGRGRNGNKVAFQSHGIWFARHGYLCLIVDTLQLGEIAAFHHGTYNLGRWWWHSRGYTPAGVEAWNGVRGIDYLVSRPDVDPDRIAVTGISGGGAATFWIAAADERVKVAVPVSGMADLESYVSNRVINGHCDCMFLYNTFQWPWTRIAELVAPRALLFVNSDQDAIFPMDANERIIHRLERVYSLHGAGDRVDAVVSVGGHAYRQDIRQAAFRFINAHLKGDARPVLDSEIDVVSEGGNPEKYPIPPESLRVFPTDDLLPADQINQSVDERFVPLADIRLPEADHFDEWRRKLAGELRRVTFGYFPEQIRAAKKLGDAENAAERLESEAGIELRLRGYKAAPAGARNILLAVLSEDEAGTEPEWLKAHVSSDERVVYCEARGVGATRWTRKNPPNYVERSHVLLGRTVDTGRVWDVIAAARYLSTPAVSNGTKRSVTVAGRGAAGIIAAYAAALADDIAGAILVSPVKTHMDAAAPQLLNVLRVCDVPDALGLLAPRPLKIVGGDRSTFARTLAIYTAAGAEEKIAFEEQAAE
ncbi:MAG TPA: prolyl oligopeptidase family serine peptidase [Pirellulales bacterium]|nr:prolyl oligopeptidase family serine peptidase [Pirellulales bacterium]